MSHVSADRPPHLWLITPRVHLCLLCRLSWQQVLPYDPCHGAPSWVPAVIKQGEAAAGITLEALYAEVEK